ncbi:2-phospho-L-lactate guanylyltransferase [Pseudonocardia sp. H11422]|uniref:2-phospho-L-lactate guanylyltransferase n=1 Tax=Pseudonocardia sp. H11422 TaxID=2835866 RepID=UPI0027E2E27C|nr:2-phospho-L-lactate guanylyltransferase [Pseudonocardia sp. H11422]
MGPIRIDTVDLVVPVKPLAAAKSRLRGAADHGVGDPEAHARLALALALDTVAAARAARRVRRLLVITSDPRVAAEVAAAGVPVAPDMPGGGLNPALERGEQLLRDNDPSAAVGALQADLPALRPAELDAAIEMAAAVFAAGPMRRAYCADADGEGTTLLVCAPGSALEPRFGTGSAEHHERSGAYPLPGDWPGLRRDVDTGEDLRRATGLGVGSHTRGVLTSCARH